MSHSASQRSQCSLLGHRQPCNVTCYCPMITLLPHDLMAVTLSQAMSTRFPVMSQVR